MAGIPFGKYQLVKRLARGGMAEVFLASQSGPEGFHRLVAVKRILPHLVDSQDFVRMFLDEARLAAQLSHPNVVHIYDFGKVDEHYFIAMEYTHGVHAGQLIKLAAADRLPDVLVARLGADACAGLQYAHDLRDVEGQALRVVHRDVSPPNLLVSYDGAVKLVDFGIAKAVSCVEQTRPGVVKGKFAYMSPEQTIGQKLDGRSDVFSLAIVLWELLAGKVMIPRTDPVEGMRMIRDGRLPPIDDIRPHLSPLLSAALNNALRSQPDQRCTAQEMGLQLEEYIKSSSEGLGSSMELAQWIRTRFPRESLSGSYPVLRGAGEPGATRQATHATQQATHATRAAPAADPSSALLPLSAAPGRVTSAGSGPIASAPDEFDADAAATIEEHHYNPPTMATHSALVAMPPSDHPPSQLRQGSTQSGIVAAPMVGSPSSSVIVAPDWRTEGGGSGTRDTVAMPGPASRPLTANPNDITIAEPNDTDVTRVLVTPMGYGPRVTTGTAPVQRAHLARRRRRQLAGVVGLLGTIGVVSAAVLASKGGGHARPPADPAALARTAPGAGDLAANTPPGQPGGAPVSDQAAADEPPPGGGAPAAGASQPTLTASAGTPGPAGATPGAGVGAVAPAGTDSGPAGHVTQSVVPEETILEIVTRPPGARVVVEHHHPTHSPARFVGIEPGSHYLRVALHGYETIARSVEVAAHERRTIEIDLVPAHVVADHTASDHHGHHDAPDKHIAEAPAPGVLKVRTRPYSEVFLGSRRLGQTPFITELKPGRYTLLFKHPGKPTQRRTVTVKAGDTTKLDFALD